MLDGQYNRLMYKIKMLISSRQMGFGGDFPTPHQPVADLPRQRSHALLVACTIMYMLLELMTDAPRQVSNLLSVFFYYLYTVGSEIRRVSGIKPI